MNKPACAGTDRAGDLASHPTIRLAGTVLQLQGSEDSDGEAAIGETMNVLLQTADLRRRLQCARLLMSRRAGT